jgi:hypothetical protein
MAVYQPTLMPTETPPSRAGSLPQGFASCYKDRGVIALFEAFRRTLGTLF